MKNTQLFTEKKKQLTLTRGLGLVEPESMWKHGDLAQVDNNEASQVDLYDPAKCFCHFLDSTHSDSRTCVQGEH